MNDGLTHPQLTIPRDYNSLLTNHIENLVLVKSEFNIPNKLFPSCFFISLSKRILVHSLSYGNEFDLQDNERARKNSSPSERLCTKTCFETEVKATQKWPIGHFRYNEIQLDSED